MLEVNVEEDEGHVRIRMKGKEVMSGEDEKQGDKSYGHMVCCKGTSGHFARDCRSNWPMERGGRQILDQGGSAKKNLCDLVAPLCEIQFEGQSFFCIPDCPSQVNARERVNTTIMKVLKGNVTAKMVEEEFTRILPRQWRWTARKITKNQFIVRFSDV
jgi:hypothetical protein